MTVRVTRLPIQLLPDPRRVITRFFGPEEENRIKDIVERLLAFPEANVANSLANLERDFRPMHPDIDEVFLEHMRRSDITFRAAGDQRRAAAGLSAPALQWNTRSSRRLCSIRQWFQPSTRRTFRPVRSASS